MKPALALGLLLSFASVFAPRSDAQVVNPGLEDVFKDSVRERLSVLADLEDQVKSKLRWAKSGRIIPKQSSRVEASETRSLVRYSYRSLQDKTEFVGILEAIAKDYADDAWIARHAFPVLPPQEELKIGLAGYLEINHSFGFGGNGIMPIDEALYRELKNPKLKLDGSLLPPTNSCRVTKIVSENEMVIERHMYSVGRIVGSNPRLQIVKKYVTDEFGRRREIVGMTGEVNSRTHLMIIGPTKGLSEGDLWTVEGLYQVTDKREVDLGQGSKEMFVLRQLDAMLLLNELAQDDDTPVANDDFREWTDSTGKFSVRAKFVALEAGLVTIEREDGQTVVLPIERLSDSDQQSIKNLLREK